MINRKFLTSAILFLSTSLSFPAWAEVDLPGYYYVKASELNVRVAPSTNAPIAGQLRKQQKVEVYEVKNGWARLTEYYLSRSLKKNVAQWVAARYLTDQKPQQKRNWAARR